MISFKIKKQVVLIYLWFSWSTTTSILVKATSDSLKPGDTLNSKSKLCSKQGKYCLHFNRTIDSEDAHLLISVNADYGTVVWMYDRNQPIDIDSAVLSLDYSGVLKIEFQNRKPIIIYSSPQPSNNTVATMLDTGNFVLQQLHPNGTKSILWQSFDYPTATLIPTMKLGINRKTGHNWSLVSSLAPSLPNSGGFILEWEPKEGELNIKKRGKVYWKSGKLKSNGIFENIPENVQQVYQYIIVSNKDENSFTFVIKDQNYKMFLGWELFSTGMLMSTEGEIANVDMCYGYNSDGGCQKWEDIPTCREPGEVFKKMTGRPNTDSATIQDNVTYGYSDCKISCWRNCDCNGFQEFYRNGSGCIFYSSNSTHDVDLEYSNSYNVMVKPTLNHHGKSNIIFFIF